MVGWKCNLVYFISISLVLEMISNEIACLFIQFIKLNPITFNFHYKVILFLEHKKAREFIFFFKSFIENKF